MSRNLKNATEVEQVSSLSVANADSDLKSSSESGSTCSIMDVSSDSSSNSVRPTLVFGAFSDYILSAARSRYSAFQDWKVVERGQVQKRMPAFLTGKLEKYWKKRHLLWQRYDEGILMDEESWYSVTPESIARSIAERCRCDLIVDGFCGGGGNTIQFALTCERVIAIDIDPEKIRQARNNARVYGVEERIEFIVGDFFKVVTNLPAANVVFLSPPWGGPKYRREKIYDIQAMIPMDGIKIFNAAKQITENIAYYVPRNVNADQMTSLAGSEGKVNLQKNLLSNHKKPQAITAYYGKLAMPQAGTFEPCPSGQCNRIFATAKAADRHFRDSRARSQVVT